MVPAVMVRWLILLRHSYKMLSNSPKAVIDADKVVSPFNRSSNSRQVLLLVNCYTGQANDSR